MYIFKVYENTLCRLRAKVNHALGVFCYTLEGLEHQVKFTDLGEIVFAAGRAGDLMFLDILLHLLVAPAVDAVRKLQAIFFCIILDHLVSAETLMALFTIHQRITESTKVSAGHPGLRFIRIAQSTPTL